MYQITTFNGTGTVTVLRYRPFRRVRSRCAPLMMRVVSGTKCAKAIKNKFTFNVVIPYKQVSNTFHPIKQDKIHIIDKLRAMTVVGPSMVAFDALTRRLTAWSFLTRSSDTSGDKGSCLQRTQPVKN